jgi:catechol 2,3-dioxygenase-like lactoylglutathione lyase family enzyme
MTISYIMIGSNDLDRSRTFYDAVMPHIGGTLAHDYAGIAFAYALTDQTMVWVGRPHDKGEARPANGSMPGFGLPDRNAIDAAHAAALAAGGSCEGPPGPRPLYGPDFYAAYVRDPDGNKMSFVVAESTS